MAVYHMSSEWIARWFKDEQYDVRESSLEELTEKLSREYGIDISLEG
jgi:hypothetical protein